MISDKIKYYRDRMAAIFKIVITETCPLPQPRTSIFEWPIIDVDMFLHKKPRKRLNRRHFAR